MEATRQDHDKVKKATPSSINEKIESRTWQRVSEYEDKSDFEISARINELNKEWDIERYLGVNMSTLALIGVALTYFVHMNWVILPAVVLLFFFQHSIHDWCPPLPILRLFKIRTSKEIEQEKYALKVLRGDFNGNSESIRYNVSDLKRVITKN